MTDRNTAAVWKLHARILAGMALVALAASGLALIQPGDRASAPVGVVVSVVWIGFALYAVLASVFVALLGPTATPRKIMMANLFGLLLAPLVTASVLTMRAQKPKPPASVPLVGGAREGAPQTPAPGTSSAAGTPAGRPDDRTRSPRP